MICYRQMLLRPTRLPPLQAQLVEGEKGLAFVDQIEVDIQQRLALRREYDLMLRPDFFK